MIDNFPGGPPTTFNPKIVNDYDEDKELSPEQKDQLQEVLEDFRDNVFAPMEKYWPDEDYGPFAETDFRSLVQGFVLAKTGSSMLAAQAWCWYSVVVDGRTVPAVLRDR